MFKSGDKVQIPVQKSFGLSLIQSDILADIEEHNVDYLFITRVESNGVYLVDVEYDSGTGYYFAEEDLELYNPAETVLELLQELKASMDRVSKILGGM